MKSIVIFIKYPTPGKVKTRLGAQVGLDLAANLYHIFIGKTFQLARNSVADQIFVAYDPEEQFNKYSQIIPSEFKHFPQKGDNLGSRLSNAFDYVFSQESNKVIVLGSDSPTLPTDFVNEAFNRLDGNDLVLGPAEDGGYYLIGLKLSHKGLFENIKWSSVSVLDTTVQRAKSLKLTRSLLPIWYDVDEVETLKRAAEHDTSGAIRSYLKMNSKIYLG